IKSGGNAFHGRSQFSWFNDKLQGTNLTDSLKAQGLGVPATVKVFADEGSDLGGRLVKDRVWFYGGYRIRYSQQGFPGFTETAAPGSPAAYDHITEHTTTGKLSWQMTPHYQFIWLTQIERTHDPNSVTNPTIGWPFASADSRTQSAQS